MADQQPERGDRSLVPTLVVRGWILPTWWFGSTLDTGSADGVVHVAITCEQLAAGVTLAAYTAEVESQVANGSQPVALSEYSSGPLLHGFPTTIRLVAWHDASGEALTTLLVASVADGWGVRCAGTAPTAVFADRRDEILALLANAELPFSEGPLATTTSVANPAHFLSVAVATALDPAVPAGGWAELQTVWRAPRSTTVPVPELADSIVCSGAELHAIALAAGTATFPGAGNISQRGTLAAAGALDAAHWGMLAREVLVNGDHSQPATLTEPLGGLVHAALKATLVVAVKCENLTTSTTVVFAGHAARLVAVRAEAGSLFRLSAVDPGSLVDELMSFASECAEGSHVLVSVLARADGHATAASETFVARSGSLVSATAEVRKSKAGGSPDAREQIAGLLPS